VSESTFANPWSHLPVEQRLVFLISTPRAGSTLLMRILNATSQIWSRPESHLIPPLAHLGFWETVEKAPFDQLQAQQATREFVRDLPGGEADYYAACRAYLDTLYGRMLETATGGERYFLEKTPANALVLPFLQKVYPNARYIVLTRHPAAIFSSYAQSFFDGDYEAAVRFNPVISRYVPAMARFLREKAAPTLQVSYEGVAAAPEEQLRKISEFLDIPFEPEALNYKRKAVAEGLGDPIGVAQHDRPVTTSIEKWASEFAASPVKYKVVATQLAGVAPEDLATWGYPVEGLWEPMRQANPTAWKEKKKQWDRWAAQRRILVWLRRDVNNRPLGRLLRKIRFFCDVLLRG
jgi:hypothetical protein